MALHVERDRLADNSSEWDGRAVRSGTLSDAGSARKMRSDLEIARDLCRRYLYEAIPVTLQERILERLRQQGLTPEPMERRTGTG